MSIEIDVVLVAIGHDKEQAKIALCKNFGGGFYLPSVQLTSFASPDAAANHLIQKHIRLPHQIFIKQAGFQQLGNRLTLIYAMILPTTNSLVSLEWVTTTEAAGLKDKIDFHTLHIIDTALKNGSRTF